MYRVLFYIINIFVVLGLCFVKCVFAVFWVYEKLHCLNVVKMEVFIIMNESCLCDLKRAKCKVITN